MRNAFPPKKAIRAEALRDLLEAIRGLRCPLDKDATWQREFSDAVDAVNRMLENQIAQAEGRIAFRKRQQRPPGRSEN